MSEGGLGEWDEWTALVRKMGPFSWVAVAAPEPVASQPVVSGLALQGSFRDGSTDSGREQVPTGALNARVDWCVGWTRTGWGKCGHPGC